MASCFRPGRVAFPCWEAVLLYVGTFTWGVLLRCARTRFATRGSLCKALATRPPHPLLLGSPTSCPLMASRPFSSSLPETHLLPQSCARRPFHHQADREPGNGDGAQVGAASASQRGMSQNCAAAGNAFVSPSLPPSHQMQLKKQSDISSKTKRQIEGRPSKPVGNNRAPKADFNQSLECRVGADPILAGRAVPVSHLLLVGAHCSFESPWSKPRADHWVRWEETVLKVLICSGL